jgi:excisionase family DNA binding protein
VVFVGPLTTRRSSEQPSTGPPDLLTIEEAAAVLRIGRTAAYQLARRYLAAGGKEGLPVVRVGRLLRVPRVELEKLIGGPITWPLPGPTTAPVDSLVPPTKTVGPTSRPRRARRTSAGQLAFLESD